MALFSPRARFRFNGLAITPQSNRGMGILADQALERLRRVVANQSEATGARAMSESTTSAIRVGVIIAAFAVLASAALYVSPSWQPAPVATAPKLEDKHPGISIGRATFPLGDGKTCRELVFDRGKGDIVDSVTAPCDSIARKTYVEPPRQGADNGFLWGRSNR